MKKMIAVLLVVVLVPLTFCSCSIAYFGDTDSENIVEKADSSQDNALASNTEKEEADSKTLKNRYFSLTVPDYWEGRYVVLIDDRSDNNETGEFLFTVSFYEADSYKRFNGGSLVDIVLTSNPNYESFAVGEKIGKMAGDRTYYFFARYPSDVQFDRDSQTVYNKMREGVPELLASIFSDEYVVTLYDQNHGEQDNAAEKIGSDFVFPESSTRKLTESEISARISSISGYCPSGSYAQDAINEIYARNGYVFKTEAISSYYESKAWYVPNSSFSYSNLSEIEKYNISLLQKFE